MTKQEKKEYAAKVRAFLDSIGAVRKPDYSDGCYEIETIAGKLTIKIMDELDMSARIDAWLACRFADVAAVNKISLGGCLNQFSGKWNWEPDQLEWFKEEVLYLIEMEVSDTIPGSAECRSAL